MSSLRGYLNDSQYQQITGGASLGDEATSSTIIGKAEAIIDAYLGNWQPAIITQYDGAAADATKSGLTIAPEHVSQMPGVNYLKGMVIEMLSGNAEGIFRIIKSQTATGALTFDADFDDAKAPEAGDIYHIYQMGKVPRARTNDLKSFVSLDTITYVKTVPAALREAVAWQIKYMQELGDTYFDSAQLNMDSEHIGSYSYTKSDNAKGGRAIIAPKARQALSGTGLINRTARIAGV